MELYTFGHGTLSREDITDLLVAAGVRELVDVRTAPGSRRHPHVARSALEEWLPEAGIGYRWEPRLGGWRKADPSSVNIALVNKSFRGYADYMRTAEFWDALDDVLAASSGARSTIMCSEAVYWRCHRRLIADAAVIGRQVEVLHLGHDGSVRPHVLTAGVRSESGQPVYDVMSERPLPGM